MPSASDRLRGRLSFGKPKRSMYCVAYAGPSVFMMRIETRLRERTSASRSRIGPRNSRVTFCGRQLPSSVGSSITSGASLMMLAGVKPCSSAAEYRNGLNAEPG